LVLTWIEADARDRLICTRCNAIQYQNPRILVTTLIEFEDRLLMCQRRDPPSAGLWTPPAGFMEQGETLEEAAARETLEETGVLVSVDRLHLYMVSNVSWMSEVYVGFRARVDAPEVSIGPECTDVRFMAENEIPYAALAFRETEGFLRLYFSERRRGAFAVHLTRIDASGGYRRSYAIETVRDIFEADAPTSRPRD
jgi:ADP-ribose pyrophosphatase YjhB (NUDIX family)